MEPQEYWLGAVRFEAIPFMINMILIVHFFASWYVSAKKTGWAIDVWYFSLLFSYFLPFLLMYPFASSSYNFMSVGTNITAIQGSFSEAYYVSLTGYLSVFVGGIIFNIYNYKTVLNTIFVAPVKHTLGFLFEKIVVNKSVTWLLFYIYFVALAILLAIAYKAGSINDPRGYFYKSEGIGRALYNFTASLSGTVSLLLTARIFQFKKLGDKIYFAFFIVGTVFIGSRSSALGPLMGFLTYIIYFNWKGRIKFRKLALYAFIMIASLTLISTFRSGKINTAKSSDNSAAVAEFFYGNSFSDLRDFAWVLSAWDREPFYGKTYLSAFMSFIPSTFSSFRTEWGIGRITARLGGFDPKEHPGLRPGSFGEPYLNFGIFGVILIGIVIGYTLRYADNKIKFYAYTDNKIEAFKAGVSLMLVSNLTITAGFFFIYGTLGIFLVLYGFKFFLKGFE
jgi:oligosaccharide repeat unit polymerase